MLLQLEVPDRAIRKLYFPKIQWSFFIWAKPDIFLLFFLLFKHKFTEINYRLQRDSNSDRQSIARWPPLHKSLVHKLFLSLYHWFCSNLNCSNWIFLVQIEHVLILLFNFFVISTLQVQVVTTGWFLLALTFRGSLIGADFIIGWVSPDGTASIIVRPFRGKLN